MKTPEHHFINPPENRSVREILQTVDEPISPQSISLLSKNENILKVELDETIQRMMPFSRPDLTIDQVKYRLKLRETNKMVIVYRLKCCI